MIAYRLWKAGKLKAKVRPGREWLPIKTGVIGENGKEIEIPTRDVGKYIDAYFWEAMDLYNTTALLECLPFSGGWAEQPYELLVILRTLKSEANRWERKEFEEKHGKGNA